MNHAGRPGFWVGSPSMTNATVNPSQNCGALADFRRPGTAADGGAARPVPPRSASVSGCPRSAKVSQSPTVLARVDGGVRHGRRTYPEPRAAGMVHAATRRSPRRGSTDRTPFRLPMFPPTEMIVMRKFPAIFGLAILIAMLLPSGGTAQVVTNSPEYGVAPHLLGYPETTPRDVQ